MCLIIFSLLFSINAFAYNSDYLDDTSWVDSESAITKIVGCEGHDKVMDCAISYLVDEENSTVYFQVLASNFGITKDSNVRLYFDVFADNKLYSFYVDKSGLHSTNDYSKLFKAKSHFISSADVGSGTYIAALDVKTKAYVNRINLSFSVDSMKYELIDGITLNKLMTTKKPTTTKINTTNFNRATTQRNNKNLPPVTVIIEDSTTKKSKKSNSKTESSTKFVGQNKYHTTTVKNNSKSKKSKTESKSKTNASNEQGPTEVVWNTYKKHGSGSININTPTAVGLALGVVGLLLISYTLGKASNKKENNKDDKENEKDSSDDENKINDDFEF